MSAGVLNLSPWARRSLVARVGYYSPGPRAIGSLSINGRQTIAILSLAARLFSRSICTSTHITLISAQRQQLTSTPLWRPSAGEHRSAVQRGFGGAWGAITRPVQIGGLVCVQFFHSCSLVPSYQDLRLLKKLTGRRSMTPLAESPQFRLTSTAMVFRVAIFR